MSKPADVDSYIADAAEDARPTLRELRELIRATVPSADELIAWNVPIYRHHGELAGFSVAKRHVSFGFNAAALTSADREALEAQGYKLGKMTLQIRFDQAVPTAAVAKILSATVAINEAQAPD